MPRSGSSRRYAQAVFQIALERDELDLWTEDLAVLASALEHREFSGLLDAPQVPASRKVDAVTEVFATSVGPLPRNLLSLLATKCIAHLLPNILEQYIRLLDTHQGIERAEVTSAATLDDIQQGKVTRFLSDMLTREVRIIPKVQPDIIGGLVARFNDKLIDGSIKTKFATMHRNIVEQVP